jgi:photosystem II stability/assembly factor-like uncharacterized protein
MNDTVHVLAASPNFAQDGVVFAARQSGLYRSSNGGQTWGDALTRLNPAAPLTTFVVALSPDFAQDGIVLAGVSGGVLRSSDSGAVWRIVEFPSPPRWSPASPCHPTSP